MEKVETGKEALLYLQKGEILISSEGMIVIKQDKRILCRANQWHAVLSDEEFLSLFESNPAFKKLGVTIDYSSLEEKRATSGYESNFVV